MLPQSSATHRSWPLILFTLTCLNASSIFAVKCPTSCKCTQVLDSLEADCSRRDLVEYPDFGDMPIEHLNLAGNKFVEFPSQLSRLESLIYLDLSDNLIEHLDSSALEGFVSLRTLILANNSIESWHSINPNRAFKTAGSLTHLSLSGNKLYNFTDENASLKLVSESLNQLELRDCNITKVSGDNILNGLPNLDRLVLSSNPLSILPTLPSQSLRVLELSRCDLQYLRTSLLEGLPNLEVLNLSWNPVLQLGSQPADVLYSSSLHELDVSFCNLDTINLSGFPHLTQLRLHGNTLHSLTPATFANNSLIEILDLGRNSLRLVEANSFLNLKRLTKLDLSYNEIARLDRNLFRANEALVFVNLSRNVIDKFTKLVSNSIRDIDLSWCEIVSIDGTALSGLTTLQNLDLSNNLIREFPGGMQSPTLQRLRLSNCRLSTLRNTTFRDFPELASLRLNGNRFTNPFPTEFFRSNRYLDRIWIGDNPWICNCHDEAFVDFYEYLKAAPQKLQDGENTRCASPPAHYGQTWQSACLTVWMPSADTSKAEKFWKTIMLSFLLIGACFLFYTCFKKVLKSRKQQRNRTEYQSNLEEMQAIRRQNARMLQEEGTPNAPNAYETNLPSYEDALLMPKLERPVKSMVDLTASSRTREKLQRIRANRSGRGDDIPESHEEDDLVIDNCHRFRSEEMLSNRAKERTAPMVAIFRRLDRVECSNSGSRHLGIEDSHFTSSHLKSQNLQSAEKMANFQSYENSPYTKRRPRIAEIPPFKRATLKADSVEFLTDPEFEASSKPSSPFARRRPKGAISKNSPTPSSPAANDAQLDLGARLDPAVEDYFGQAQSRTNSSQGSDFQLVVEPEIISTQDVEYSTSSAGEQNLERGRRKKRKNSISRRASGIFTAALAEAAAESSSSSDRGGEPIVVIHKPMKETLF